jgi:polyisoprenoid-binding protein YceI
MLTAILRLVPALAIASVLAPQCFAQTKPLTIDSGHSVAIISLVASANTNPPYNVGNAEVMGWVTPSGKDPLKSTLEFFIYPARQGPNLFDANGNLRFDTYADLARYSFISFKSKRAAWNHAGQLELTGDLILTHVVREPTMNFSIAYNGPSYSEPDTDRIAREATFVIQTPREDLEAGLENGRFQLIALATIPREDFPELWPALRDSIWPVVVEDRNCRAPESGPSMRDYKGFDCTGKVVAVTPPPDRPRDFNAAYPGNLSSNPPIGNDVTILVRLNVVPSLPSP